MGDYELPVSAVQPVNPSDGVGSDIRALEQNASRIKMTDPICPKPVIVVAQINGHPCRALLDSGSLSDFMSTTVADQLKVKLELLDKPLPLQLAVSGSRSRVKVRTTVQFRYQKVNEHTFQQNQSDHRQITCSYCTHG